VTIIAIILLFMVGQVISCVILAIRCISSPLKYGRVVDGFYSFISRMFKRLRLPIPASLLRRLAMGSSIWHFGILPIIWLFISTGFTSGYQGEKTEDWVGYVHEGLAGIVGLPLFVIASMLLVKSMLKLEYRKKSGSAVIANLILIIFCAHYTYACLFMRFGVREILGDVQMFALAPGISGLCYFVFFLETLRIRDEFILSRSQAAAWLAGIIATIAAKIYAAQQVFNALPESPPRGYGDCFVVSAAAKGHPGFVGSWEDNKTGCRINQQLIRLKRFETCLMEHTPRFHRLLRAVYNTVGPMVARAVVSKSIADAIYLLLKPLELFVCLLLFMSSMKRKRNQGNNP
jgi:hypothetical protein